MQGETYDFKKHVAGGGLRFLALLAAVATLAATVVDTPTVQADEGDTLYCINSSDVKIRPYAGAGTVTEISRIIVNQVTRHYGSQPMLDMVGAKINGNWSIIDPATCKSVTIESFYGDNSWNTSTEISATSVDISNRNPHSGIGVGYKGSMVDSDGRLWFTTSDSSITTLDQHASETYRFSHIAGYSNDSKIYGGYLFTFSDGFKTLDSGSSNQKDHAETSAEQHYAGTVLLGHRVNEQNNQPSTVAQMPTTGAPEGLSTVGVLAIGVGLAGVSLMLSRRRD